MLVYKPKHHLKQQTRINYPRNFEMTHLNSVNKSMSQNNNFA